MSELIDVYTANQTVTDWTKVKGAGIDGVYVKLSDGVDLRANHGYPSKAQSAGIMAGGYHYAQPGNAVVQANVFVGAIRSSGAVDLRPALDIEDNAKIHTWSNSEAINFSVAFLRQIQTYGYGACIYSNDAKLQAILPGIMAQVKDVFVWAARLGNPPKVRPYHLHQYSWTGVVPGIIASGVDMSSGTLPLNPSVAGGKGTDMTSFVPTPLDYSGGKDEYVVLPVEVGSNSQLFSDMWFSLTAGWGDTDYEVVLLGPNQTLVGPDPASFATQGTIKDRQRFYWKLPSGCNGVGLKYNNKGNGRLGYAFTVKER